MADAHRSLPGEDVAVVTGGGRGIGRAVALDLSEHGAPVAVVARTGAEIENTAAAIRGRGGRALAIAADVTRRGEIEAAIRTVERELGPVGLLVNSAGVTGIAGDFWDVDIDAWWRTVEVDFRGAAVCAHVVLPGMLERGRGRIINMASDVALRRTSRKIDYACSKAALVRLTECLADACARRGVSLFALSPGMVKTQMTEARWRDRDDVPPGFWTPLDTVCAYVRALAGGRADALSGRYLHVRRDPLDDAIARADEIARRDLLTLRLTTS